MSTPASNLLSKSQVEDILAEEIRNESLLGAEIIVNAGCSKGQGFLSYLTSADIKGKTKTLSLILKRAPDNEEFRKLMPIRELFLREINFYEKILPIYQQLEKNAEKPLNSFVKSYKTNRTEFQELLVMENIKTRGFKLSKKYELLDDNHFDLVLEGYAKLHALSFALKDQKPDIFADLTQNMPLVMGPKYFSQAFFNTVELMLDKIDPLFPDEEDILRSLKKFKENFMKIFHFVQEDVTKYAVISHGDCWANNFMFQYQDVDNPEKPTEFKFLDFQLQHFGSPVIDLSYFIYSSSSKIRLDKLDKYLDKYHNALSNHIKSLGSDPDKLYPKEALKRDWPVYCRYGFLISLLLTSVLFTEADEILDITDVVESDVTFEETINIKHKNQGLMDAMTVGLTRHMHENGFFNL